MADTQSRKWQLTINNPQQHGLDHEKIKGVLQQIKPLVYYCLSDEIGLETHTPHTHISKPLLNLAASKGFSQKLISSRPEGV